MDRLSGDRSFIEIIPDSSLLRSQFRQILLKGELSQVTGDNPPICEDSGGCKNTSSMLAQIRPATLVSNDGQRIDISSPELIKQAKLQAVEVEAIETYRKSLHLCLSHAIRSIT